MKGGERKACHPRGTPAMKNAQIGAKKCAKNAGERVQCQYASGGPRRVVDGIGPEDRAGVNA